MVAPLGLLFLSLIAGQSGQLIVAAPPGVSVTRDGIQIGVIPSIPDGSPVNGEELRASTIAGSSEGDGWSLVLPFAAVLFLVVWYWRQRLLAEHLPEQVAPPPDLTYAARSSVPLRPLHTIRSTGSLSRTAFLDDLRRREEEKENREDENETARGVRVEPLRLR